MFTTCQKTSRKFFQINLLPFIYAFISKLIVSQYSCFTMLCQFLMYRKMNQPKVNIYFLCFGFASQSGHHSASSRVSCVVYRRFSLVSCFIYSIYSVQVSTPISQFLPPPSLTPGASIYLFSASVSLFLFHKRSSTPLF